MNELEFDNLNDLYRKVLPALNTKVADLSRSNIKYIKASDIWHYLKGYYWQGKENLSLGEIVNDILSTPNAELEDYYLKGRNKKATAINQAGLL